MVGIFVGLLAILAALGLTAFLRRDHDVPRSHGRGYGRHGSRRLRRQQSTASYFCSGHGGSGGSGGLLEPVEREWDEQRPQRPRAVFLLPSILSRRFTVEPAAPQAATPRQGPTDQA